MTFLVLAFGVLVYVSGKRRQARLTHKAMADPPLIPQNTAE